MIKAIRYFVIVSVILVLFATARRTYADSFDFSYSGGGVTASGTLTATLMGGGEYQVTAIFGMRNGDSITALEPCTTSPYCVSSGGLFIYDDILYPTATPQLDFEGLLYDVNDPSLASPQVNIFFCASGVTLDGCSAVSTPTYVDAVYTTKGYVITPVSFVATSVPEPSSLLLLGSGLMGLGAWRRKVLKHVSSKEDV